MIDLIKNNPDHRFMKEALKEAGKSLETGDVPVGCVIVKDDKIIARGHNVREKSNSLFGHAEMIAIQKAVKKIGCWRLDECCLYVTLEPCAMCSGAMIQARIKRLVYGSREPKFGAHQSIINLFDAPFNHHVQVVAGVLEEESSRLLKDFFKKIRQQKSLNKTIDMI
ncbi:MAG: tRNA adenosine(34) deaminase TadA [Candidatus Izemoplasmatales bacterium]|jgi:tRNA(adenine34) deaminase|nr:tRNA adenosine(34) deaminase TadA [Candidatus Izemoplasmatales bacterium]MDD4988109.1 tRNA adenosine(34) deaminase TadA [Candidatus Izemoplasmatales bacterium]MDY0374075.1 tRNA adenosine(34) deaminase TadA [Candidatus Izemoplasmatales bacterium]